MATSGDVYWLTVTVCLFEPFEGPGVDGENLVLCLVVGHRSCSEISRGDLNDYEICVEVGPGHGASGEALFVHAPMRPASIALPHHIESAYPLRYYLVNQFILV